ncbi:MAG: NADH-quinone oxidoreductase subunit C [Chloroflexi bacterium]|nr:NADH-quinone oxidoreductase subunit C [Chloroflexota bacterium]
MRTSTVAASNSERYETIAPDQLRQVAARLIADGARFVTLFGRHCGEGVEVLVAFAIADHLRVLRTTLMRPHLRYAALTPSVPAAAWAERHLSELFGVQPEGHPDPRRLLVHQDATISLSSSVAGTGVFTIPYGPVRSGIFETNQFIIATAGEDILQVDMRPGFKHRGAEQHFERVPIQQAVLLAERVSGTATIAHSTAFCSAVERALDIPLPAAAAWLRVLAAELERVYNHIDIITRLCEDASQSIAQAQFAIFKEDILRYNTLFGGSRFLRGINTIGGVRIYPSQEAMQALYALLDRLEGRLYDRLHLLIQTNSFIDRLIGTAPLPPTLAQTMGAVGPVARACGLEYDARLERPYAAYPHCDWEIALASAGDAMERLRIRIHEIYSSVSIIRQALEALHELPLLPPPPFAWREHAEAFGWAESPRGEVLYWLRLGAPDRIDRCAIRSPSFTNWPLFTLAVTGNVLTDFAFAEHSFGLTQAGCDR